MSFIPNERWRLFGGAAGRVSGRGRRRDHRPGGAAQVRDRDAARVRAPDDGRVAPPLVQPVAEAASICRRAGVPLWVDAAQALGHVATSCGAAAMHAVSRKWLTGPRGVGILAVAEPWSWRQQAPERERRGGRGGRCGGGVRDGGGRDPAGRATRVYVRRKWTRRRRADAAGNHPSGVAQSRPATPSAATRRGPRSLPERRARRGPLPRHRRRPRRRTGRRTRGPAGAVRRSRPRRPACGTPARPSLAGFPS